MKRMQNPGKKSRSSPSFLVTSVVRATLASRALLHMVKLKKFGKFRAMWDLLYFPLTLHLLYFPHIYKFQRTQNPESGNRAMWHLPYSPLTTIYKERKTHNLEIGRSLPFFFSFLYWFSALILLWVLPPFFMGRAAPGFLHSRADD